MLLDRVRNFQHSAEFPHSASGKWIKPIGKSSLVSVIVPSYNRSEFIEVALDSVFEQKYRPIELIVVDDGSTDKTETIVREWMSKHSSPDVFEAQFISQEHAGAPVARNLGTIASHGAYIQYLDSDDILLPDKIEAGVLSLRSKEVDYVYCRAELTDSKLRRLGRCHGLPIPDGDAAISVYYWQTMCPLFRRETVASAGPWKECLINSQDWEYRARLELLGASKEFDSEVRALFRTHDKGTIGGGTLTLEQMESLRCAYEGIIRIAILLDLLSSELRRRICRRSFLTAMQCGSEGYWGVYQRVINNLREFSLGSPLAIWCLLCLGRFRSRMLCRAVKCGFLSGLRAINRYRLA